MRPVRGTPAARTDARRERDFPTRPEALLWSALRRRQLGVHFRRQHAAGQYILDFYCAAARLAVEVDGEQHDFTVAHDTRRDLYLTRTFGLKILRFSAAEVQGNLTGVVENIRQHLHPSSLG